MTTGSFAFFLASLPAVFARLPLYRLESSGSRPSMPRESEVDNQSWSSLELNRALVETTFMSMDTELSMPLETDSSTSFDNFMSMPNCGNYDECPATGSCDCGGNIADGGDICNCYDVQSVSPPFNEQSNHAVGTWYCFQIDLDRSHPGCGGGPGGAKAVSHAVFATGFAEKCTFHIGGKTSGGSDDWGFEECDNTAATGLKFDFGHDDRRLLMGGGGEGVLSVTYCFDVSCEDAPAGQGTSTWVLKAGNDRCEINVPGGPSCGLSPDECHPSCSVDASVANTGATDSTPTTCEGSTGQIGSDGTLTADLSVSLEVETSASDTDLFDGLAEDVLELAANGNSLCGTSRLRTRSLTSSISGIRLVSVSSTDTCQPQQSSGNACEVIKVELRLSGDDSVGVDASMATTINAIQANTEILKGGYIVRVAVIDEGSSAVTAEHDHSSSSTDKSWKKKRTVVLTTVLAAAGCLAAALFVANRSRKESRKPVLGDDASSSGGSFMGSSTAHGSS